MSTAMIELRSRARAPSSPMITAATSEPTIGPGDDADAEQQAAAAPGERQFADAVHGERAGPASSRRRRSRPPTMPSTAPAMIELCRSASSSP